MLMPILPGETPTSAELKRKLYNNSLISAGAADAKCAYIDAGHIDSSSAASRLRLSPDRPSPAKRLCVIVSYERQADLCGTPPRKGLRGSKTGCEAGQRG
jgi:hypothetical protein